MWTASLRGEPVSNQGLPGDLVTTDAGPVIVDHGEEVYRVRARVGLALVAPDGEVVVRYVDTYEALLSDRADPAQAARDLARDLAAQVALIWPTDRRLLDDAISDLGMER